MSYSKKLVPKMFCKVCQDAGKSESEYTTHYVRSRDRGGNSTVTCPILLQTECRFCYTKGHTTKYCPAIAAKNKERGGAMVFPEIHVPAKEQKKTSAKEPIKLPTTNKKVFPSFAALANLDSDDEDEAVVEVKPAPKTQLSWADIATVATKPAIVPQAVDPYENYTLLTQTVVHKRRYEEDPSPKSIPIPTRKVHCNWADAESSESDDDDNAPDNECTY
jgi:hypothetical protein